MLVQITDSKNMVNNVGILNNSVAMNNIFSEWYHVQQCFLRIVQGWAMNHVNSAGNIPRPKTPSVNLNVWIIDKYSYFVQEPHITWLTYSGVTKPTHVAEWCYAQVKTTFTNNNENISSLM